MSFFFRLVGDSVLRGQRRALPGWSCASPSPEQAGEKEPWETLTGGLRAGTGTAAAGTEHSVTSAHASIT